MSSSDYPRNLYTYYIVCPARNNQSLQLDYKTLRVILDDPYTGPEKGKTWVFHQQSINLWAVTPTGPGDHLGTAGPNPFDGEGLNTASTNDFWSLRPHASDPTLFKIYWNDTNYLMTGGLLERNAPSVYVDHEWPEPQGFQYFKFVEAPSPANFAETDPPETTGNIQEVSS